MANNPQPISNYTDPRWYDSVRGFNNGTLSGPVAPPSFVRPLPAIQYSDTDYNNRAIPEEDTNFWNVRNLQDMTSLNNTQNLLKNRALQSDIVNTIKNQALQKSLPQEYTYTTDVDKLKDRLVMILRSPDASSNPGFNRNNRDQSLAFKAYDKLIEATGFNNPNSTANTFAKQVTDTVSGFLPESVKSVAGDIVSGVTGTVKDLITPGGASDLAKTNFEFLNQKFYTSGNNGDRYRIVHLPMPRGQLVDSHAHSINGVGMNPAAPLASIALSALDALTGGGGGLGSSRGVGSRGFSVPTGAAQYAFTAAQLNGRKALNPAMETLYQSPTPRQWQFTFSYSPTSKSESDNFIKIVEMLKAHSYPTVDAQAVLYNFPGTVDFYFVINGKEHKPGVENSNQSNVLPRSLFPCFIKSVQVDYINEAPFYSHFYDGTPTSIQLTLELVETKLLTRESLDTRLDSGQAEQVAKAATALAEGSITPEQYIGITDREGTTLPRAGLQQ